MKFLNTITVLCFALFVSSCNKLPIPAESQIQAASVVGCAVLKESGCYGEIETVFPGMQEATCADTVTALLKAADKLDKLKDKGDETLSAVTREASETLAQLNNSIGINYELWDVSKVDVTKIKNLRNGKCSKLLNAMGVIK